jgi:hypothetical protein
MLSSTPLTRSSLLSASPGEAFISSRIALGIHRLDLGARIGFEARQVAEGLATHAVVA